MSSHRRTGWPLGAIDDVRLASEPLKVVDASMNGRLPSPFAARAVVPSALVDPGSSGAIGSGTSAPTGWLT